MVGRQTGRHESNARWRSRMTIFGITRVTMESRIYDRGSARPVTQDDSQIAVS